MLLLQVNTMRKKMNNEIFFFVVKKYNKMLYEPWVNQNSKKCNLGVDASVFGTP